MLTSFFLYGSENKNAQKWEVKCCENFDFVVVDLDLEGLVWFPEIQKNLEEVNLQCRYSQFDWICSDVENSNVNSQYAWIQCPKSTKISPDLVCNPLKILKNIRYLDLGKQK